MQYLWGEVMLLQLSALSQVPAAHSVVQTPRPQFGPVVGNIDTTGSICVTLELPIEGDTRTSHDFRKKSIVYLASRSL